MSKANSLKRARVHDHKRTVEREKQDFAKDRLLSSGSVVKAPSKPVKAGDRLFGVGRYNAYREGIKEGLRAEKAEAANNRIKEVNDLLTAEGITREDRKGSLVYAEAVAKDRATIASAYQPMGKASCDPCKLNKGGFVK